MVRAKVLLLDAQCSSEPRFSALEIALSRVDHSEAAERGRHFQIPRAVAALEHLKGMLEQLRRLLVMSDRDKNAGERGAVSSSGRVIWTERRLVDSERLSRGRFAIGRRSSSVSEPA